MGFRFLEEVFVNLSSILPKHLVLWKVFSVLGNVVSTIFGFSVRTRYKIDLGNYLIDRLTEQERRRGYAIESGKFK